MNKESPEFDTLSDRRHSIVSDLVVRQEPGDEEEEDDEEDENHRRKDEEDEYEEDDDDNATGDGYSVRSTSDSISV